MDGTSLLPHHETLCILRYENNHNEEGRSSIKVNKKDEKIPEDTESLGSKKLTCPGDPVRTALLDPVRTDYPGSSWIPRVHGPQKTPCARGPSL